MTFKVFKNENVINGLPDSFSGPQADVSNVDQVLNPETNLGFPFIINQSLSWIAYNCWIEVELDAGFTLHKPLPQSDDDIDTLATADIDQTNFDTLDTGINTKSNGSFTDFVQRCATSTYIFKLKGVALRVGYRIPIPGLTSVAGVQPTPAERQWARNVLVGNFSGIPVFRAEWDLWYYVTAPPTQEQLPPDNLALHISAKGSLPDPDDGINIPTSAPDWNAVSTLPTPSDLRLGIAFDKSLGE